MVNGKQIASIAGLTLAVTFSFFPIPALFDRLQDRFDVSGHVLSMILMLSITAVLALLAFAVQKRPLSFFGLRGFGWRDLGAMFVAVFYAYGLLLAATAVIGLFAAPKSGGTDAADEAEHIPLALGLTAAVVAGITEEFIYRGFVIEELGELIQNRPLAGALSVAVFTLAHHVTSYGWSINLIYPAVFGSVITLLYFWRRNLPICILMHAAIDALQAWRAS
jgi:uncharacterized protein